MKRISLTFLFCASLFIVGCKNNKKMDNDMDNSDSTEMNSSSMDQDSDMQEVKKATATLEAKSGSNLEGNVVFTQENGQVKMTAVISGLAEGKHAIHIHEKGDCSADDGTSAGGHWNPTDSKHGKWGSEDGYHRGDIGNFEVDADGNGTISMTTDEWCIDCDDDSKNIVGKAIIVHDGVDDFTSQPSGDAGKRVGCGVIETQM